MIRLLVCRMAALNLRPGPVCKLKLRLDHRRLFPGPRTARHNPQHDQLWRNALRVRESSASPTISQHHYDHCATHRRHDVYREEEDLDLVPARERDDVRDAGERRDEHALDDDRRRARVRAPDLVTHRLPVPAPHPVDARADERGRDDFERDDRGRVRDPEVLREPREVVCVWPARVDQLRDSERCGDDVRQYARVDAREQLVDLQNDARYMSTGNAMTRRSFHTT